MTIEYIGEGGGTCYKYITGSTRQIHDNGIFECSGVFNSLYEDEFEDLNMDLTGFIERDMMPIMAPLYPEWVFHG